MARNDPPVSVTLSDLAERAGVSLATASRVINGSPDRTVGEPYRTRVLEAAQELGYTPNALAQAVARGASNLMGLVVQDIVDPYFSTIADGVTRVAESQGMVVVLMAARHDPEREIEALASLRAQRVRAIVIVGSRRTGRRGKEHTRQMIESFTAVGGRIACVSQDQLGIDTVAPRNRAGSRALARTLTAMGHERFAVLAGPRELLTAGDRVRGFRDGLRDSGIEPKSAAAIHGPFTRDGGFQSAQQVLADVKGVTCVFAVNDVMAVGAMAAFREAGVEIPHDISIAGFDDIATLRDVAPPLTTVRLPLREMGEWAAEMALNPEGDKPRVRLVDAEVVIRASTAPPEQ